MLNEIALEYYHTDLNGFNLTVMELFHKLQDHFEGQEHRQYMLYEWNSVKLRSMW